MIKKILLGVVVLGVIAFAVLGYGTYKVADQILKEQEPQLRQYMQLNEEQQNNYIVEHAKELLLKLDLNKDGKPEDKEQIELFIKANDNPEVKAALTDVGRSLMATAIIASDAIVKDMTPDIKAKYDNESNEFEARFDKYSKLVEEVEPGLKS